MNEIKAITICTAVILIAVAFLVGLIYYHIKAYTKGVEFVHIDVWKRYFETVLERQDYHEAERINNLLASDWTGGMVMLPQSYKLYDTIDSDGIKRSHIMKVK